jgi:hypothetical protein
LGDIGDPYIGLSDLKKVFDVKADATDKDERLQLAVDTASREVERFCRRQFNQASTATARVFYSKNPYFVKTDDFFTTTGLVIKTGDPLSGFSSELDAGSYYTEPLNGVVDGVPGWPFSRIRGSFIRCYYHVEVTARWGWEAVPAAVRQSTLLIAEKMYKLDMAPLGVAGFNEFGSVRVRDIPDAYRHLCRYVNQPVLVG